MTTVQSPEVGKLWSLIHAYEPQAEFGGSVPNLATELSHSYHRSWDDSPHDDGYSVHYWGDKHMLGGKTQYACALDVTLPTTDLMEKYTARFHRLAIMHPYAYRTFGLREFAGTLDGVNVFAWDLTTHQRTYGWNKSHLWHIHLSFNRRLVTNSCLLKIAQIFHP